MSKIHIKDLTVRGQSNYYENGRRFAIIFDGVDVDMPQCYISSSINDPLIGSNPTFYESTLAEFGENLIFEPIP